MDESQKTIVLRALRKAHREARIERQENRSILDAYLEKSRPLESDFVDEKTERLVLAEAQGRNLLSKFELKTATGEVQTYKVADIRGPEKYNKRPSTRAVRRSRQNRGPEPG